jgi:hypothetical protein
VAGLRYLSMVMAGVWIVMGGILPPLMAQGSDIARARRANRSLASGNNRPTGQRLNVNNQATEQFRSNFHRPRFASFSSGSAVRPQSRVRAVRPQSLSRGARSLSHTARVSQRTSRQASHSARASRSSTRQAVRSSRHAAQSSRSAVGAARRSSQSHQPARSSLGAARRSSSAGAPR